MSLGTLCHVILVVNKPSTSLNSLSRELFKRVELFSVYVVVFSVDRGYMSKYLIFRTKLL